MVTWQINVFQCLPTEVSNTASINSHHQSADFGQLNHGVMNLIHGLMYVDVMTHVISQPFQLASRQINNLS